MTFKKWPCKLTFLEHAFLQLTNRGKTLLTISAMCIKQSQYTSVNSMIGMKVWLMLVHTTLLFLFQSQCTLHAHWCCVVKKFVLQQDF